MFLVYTRMRYEIMNHNKMLRTHLFQHVFLIKFDDNFFRRQHPNNMKWKCYNNKYLDEFSKLLQQQDFWSSTSLTKNLADLFGKICRKILVWNY